MASAHRRRGGSAVSRRVRAWPAGLAALVVVLALLLAGFIVVVLVQATDGGREELLRSLAQVCAEFLLIGVVGLLIKQYVDDRRAEQERADSARRAEQEQADSAREEERRRQDALDAFRLDILRRLVGTANAVRRAGIALDAERSIEAYAEQMRSLTDAYLDLRVLMHEVAGDTDSQNPVIPDWDRIKPHLFKMRDYLHECIGEFRDRNPELQRYRSDQKSPAKPFEDIWAEISSFPRVSEVLVEDPRPSGQAPTAIWSKFFGPYEEAVPMIRRAILRGGTRDIGGRPNVSTDEAISNRQSDIGGDPGP